MPTCTIRTHLAIARLDLLEPVFPFSREFLRYLADWYPKALEDLQWISWHRQCVSCKPLIDEMFFRWKLRGMTPLQRLKLRIATFLVILISGGIPPTVEKARNYLRQEEWL